MASLLSALLENMIVKSFKGGVQMHRFHALALVGALLATAFIATACTSTAPSRNGDMPMNSACALGFNNDRPCSY